jgi:PAS domain S-box-containing protein
MEGTLKILFNEDVKLDAEFIWRELAKNEIGFKKLLVDNKKDFIAGLESFKPDLIISDYSLPQFTGMQALVIRNEISPLTPFILVTGSNNETVAVDCMKTGADDYILKDNLSRLGLSVNNAINKIKVIKEKNIAEEALRESEERYRLIVEKSPNTIAIHQDGKLVFINPAGAKLLGTKNSEELIGRSILDVVHPDGRRNVIKRMQQVAEGMEAPLFDEKFIKLDGTVIDVEVVGIPISYQGRNATQVIVRDITERKHAEANLMDSEERLKVLFDYAPEPYYLSDLKGNFLDGNLAAEELLGYKRNELIGKNFLKLSLLSLNQLPRAAKLLLENTFGKATGPDEFILNRQDGTTVIVEIITHPLKIRDRNVVLGMVRDITQRKQAEEALNQNLVFSESLLKTIPFGMDIVDEEGNVLFLSDTFKGLLGDEAIGKKCWDLYRYDKKQCIDCPLSKGITVGKTESYESYGVLGERVFEINHTGMIYQGKRALLEIFQDITDRKINETELISAKEKAEESDRLKTAFLNNISHEIRTPMNAIVGFSALLGEPEIDNHTRQTYIEMIMQGSNHLLSIISDIMDISNIEANLAKIAKNETSVNSVLKSLYTQFLPKANEKSINFFCKNGLSDADALIITDSTKLNQILSNLLSNAFKFTDTGSVNLGYEKEGSFLKFSVTDTGIGIQQEFHEKIFNRFYQVESSDTRLYEGTGLGLAISSAYVGLLGGKMWLSSEPGTGATFYFTLPYQKQAHETRSKIEKPANADFVFKKKMKILVAEDVESNFKLISYFLHGANTELLRARTGRETVDQCLADGSIDLILMDIKMPEMDGYTAVKLIREANISIPIIAQTAYADDMDKAIESGCSGFISKPFDKKGLLHKISEYIS